MQAIKECQSRQGAIVETWKILTCCSMELKKGIHITSTSMVAARASGKGMSEQAKCDCGNVENTYKLLDGIQKGGIDRRYRWWQHVRAIKECQSRQGATVQKWKILTSCSMELKKGIHISSISMVAARASDKGMSEQARFGRAKEGNTYPLLDEIKKRNPYFVDIDGGSACKR